MTPLRALGLALLVTATADCTKKTDPGSGLLVKMTTNGTFDVPLTKLRIELGATADGGASITRDYAIPSQATLPASFGVQSSGRPGSSVLVTVSVWSGDTPLDVRRYEVLDVPTSSIEEVDIAFSPLCTRYAIVRDGVAASSCGPTSTCDPATGGCVSDVYGSGAPADAGSSGNDATTADASLDAGARDATTDAAEAAAPVCAEDAGMQCNDSADTPQRCIGGQWVDQTPCLSMLQYCSQGVCRTVPPSCQGSDTFQCDSLEVPGGMFYRSFDDAGSTSTDAPATVSGFRLDAYEVDLGRFLAFEDAVDLGLGLPDAGAGKHRYLNDGNGLRVGTTDGGAPVYESGWDPSWAASFATNDTEWSNNLYCTPYDLVTEYTSNRFYPINCVTWFEAYAFCIWDGGFLPTEAEWNFAASGGTEYRIFPWGSQDPGAGPAYAAWGCFYGGQGVCTGAAADIAYVNDIPGGVGRWGQWNLAGNLAEWTLDGYEATYPTPCDDCAAPDVTQKVFRGGSFETEERLIHNAYRAFGDPATRDVEIGFRCARSP